MAASLGDFLVCLIVTAAWAARAFPTFGTHVAAVLPALGSCAEAGYESEYRRDMRRTRLFLLGLVLVSLVEAARQWNSAPSLVPSHFDAAGRPNAWSSRGEFFTLQVGVTLLIAALFIGIPRLLKSTPASLINLPNKSYWLAPERHEETMDHLASSFEVFACATVLLLIVLFELTSLASHGGNLATNYFLPVLVSYLVFSAGWTVSLIWRFANVPSEG